MIHTNFTYDKFLDVELRLSLGGQTSVFQVIKPDLSHLEEEYPEIYIHETEYFVKIDTQHIKDIIFRVDAGVIPSINELKRSILVKYEEIGFYPKDNESWRNDVEIIIDVMDWIPFYYRERILDSCHLGSKQ